MKVFSILLFLCLALSFQGRGQALDSAQWYDFWVGKWDLTWSEGEGKQGKGTNHVVKILDSVVIQENFEATEGQNKGFKGMSLSVFNQQKKKGGRFGQIIKAVISVFWEKKKVINISLKQKAPS